MRNSLERCSEQNYWDAGNYVCRERKGGETKTTALHKVDKIEITGKLGNLLLAKTHASGVATAVNTRSYTHTHAHYLALS